MKKLSTFKLVPGMTIAENVLSYDRQVILAKGTVLTDNNITRLEMYGVLSVYIEEDTSEEEVPENNTPIPEVVAPSESGGASAPTYAQRIRETQEFKAFKKDFEESTDGIKFVLNEMVEKNTPVDTNALMEKPLELVKAAGGRVGLLDMLSNMRDYDDSTFAHSMNVALLNFVAAGWLGWSAEDQELAMSCGLLHDIGKLQIEHEILTKPGKLTPMEYSKIQKHPVLGYSLLKDQAIDTHIKYAALMHHERYDGSGYPMKLTGKKIDNFALLTAITDVYDAMTSARVYRGAMCPFHVIAIFEEEGFEKYESDYLLTFLSNVANTYIRCSCQLSDGRSGDIIMMNKEKYSRPVIQCGKEYVDLMKHPELRIEKLI